MYVSYLPSYVVTDLMMVPVRVCRYRDLVSTRRFTRVEISIIFTCSVFMAVQVLSVYPRRFFSSTSLFCELENKKVRVNLVGSGSVSAVPLCRFGFGKTVRFLTDPDPLNYLGLKAYARI
jgi:hypothetical protein